VGMGKTERLVVQRYQEATGCIDGCRQVAGQVGQDSDSFRSKSVHAPCSQCRDERGPGFRFNVGQGRRVHHDRGGADGYLLQQFGQALEQVASDELGAGFGGNVQRRSEVVGTVAVFRLDQALQPAAGVRVAGVERVQVQPAAPCDRGYRCR